MICISSCAMISLLQDESFNMLHPTILVYCWAVPGHITPALLYFIPPLFSLPSLISFATNGCPNCQCCILSSIYSVVDVTCPCLFCVFNYFHNVHNFSLIPHPLISFSGFISGIDNVSFHAVLGCRQLFIINLQVSDLYVIAGRIHWLKIFLVKHIGSVTFIMMLYLLNACHPVLILVLISFLFLFSNSVKRWPK